MIHTSKWSVETETFWRGAAHRTRITPKPRPASGAFCPQVCNGYSLTKLVGEALVLEAHAQGLPCVVARCGLVTWDTQTGAANPDDVLNRIIAGMVMMGCGYRGPTPHTRAPDPKAPTLPMEGLPVDTLSTVLLALMWHVPQARLGPSLAVGCLRACLQWPTIWAGLASFGYCLRCMGYEEWRATLETLPDANPLRALIPHLSLTEMPLVQPSHASEGGRMLQSIQQDYQLQWPEVGVEHVHRLLRYLVSSGVIAAPSSLNDTPGYPAASPHPPGDD